MNPELSEWFVGAAAKRLSEVEINPARSNQHEFQATSLVRAFLGQVSGRQTSPARFLYLDDAVEPVVVENSWVTYYDARSNQPRRSPEYRLYYPDNDATMSGAAGDVLVIAALKDGSTLVAIARDGSTYASQILYLLGISANSTRFVLADQDALDAVVTPADAEILLDLFGIEVGFATPDDAGIILERFGSTFPTTAELSSLARELSEGPSPLEDPDEALLSWWETEYRLFQVIERRIVEKRLEERFSGSTAVEDFLRFSLSVQNRRKSRSGHAFENHLAALFDVHGIKFARGALTERNAKPDFLFPDRASYMDLDYPENLLRMLGAKTTAKDRWRQVLSEADRLQIKHLATMEPAISVAQTDEMRALNVQLIVPHRIRTTYTSEQQHWVWTVQDFIDDIKEHAGSSERLNDVPPRADVHARRASDVAGPGGAERRLF